MRLTREDAQIARHRRGTYAQRVVRSRMIALAKLNTTKPGDNTWATAS